MSNQKPYLRNQRFIFIKQKNYTDWVSFGFSLFNYILIIIILHFFLWKTLLVHFLIMICALVLLTGSFIYVFKNNYYLYYFSIGLVICATYCIMVLFINPKVLSINFIIPLETLLHLWFIILLILISIIIINIIFLLDTYKVNLIRQKIESGINMNDAIFLPKDINPITKKYELRKFYIFYPLNYSKILVNSTNYFGNPGLDFKKLIKNIINLRWKSNKVIIIVIIFVVFFIISVTYF